VERTELNFDHTVAAARERSPRRRRLAQAMIGLAILVANTVALPERAAAHPHVWISVVAELLYGPDGRITGVRQVWTFDEMFSAFATRGIAQQTQGTFTREELGPLAKTYMDGLKDFDYFTFARLDGERQKEFFAEPADYFIDYDPTLTTVTLNFTLPLKTPAPGKSLEVLIYDPQLYFYLSFARFDPVHLIGAPAQCRPLVKTAAEDAASATDTIAGMVTTSTSTIWVKCS
jgi:ABC-type uncharacterized transport system substrate-binding protein